MNFKIYYINLNKSSERNKFMQDQLERLNIEYERIEATDGTSLDKQLLDSIDNSLKEYNEHYCMPKLGEIGAYYSHYQSWKLIAEHNEDFGLVLEDDVIINDELIDDLKQMIRSVNDSEIIDISGRKGFFKKEEKTISKDLILTRYSTPPLGMTGKLIGKNAAKKLVNMFESYIAPVDVMMQRVDLHKVHIWQTNKPYLTINDHNLGGTTIQNKKSKSFDKLIREIKRPFYRTKIKLINLFNGK